MNDFHRGFVLQKSPYSGRHRSVTLIMTSQFPIAERLLRVTPNDQVGSLITDTLLEGDEMENLEVDEVDEVENPEVD